MPISLASPMTFPRFFVFTQLTTFRGRTEPLFTGNFERPRSVRPEISEFLRFSKERTNSSKRLRETPTTLGRKTSEEGRDGFNIHWRLGTAGGGVAADLAASAVRSDRPDENE